VDGHLISLSEYGELVLFKANPEKYEEVSRFEVPELDYPCWAAPVVSNGILYVRGKGPWPSGLSFLGDVLNERPVAIGGRDKLIALELIPRK